MKDLAPTTSDNLLKHCIIGEVHCKLPVLQLNAHGLIHSLLIFVAAVQISFVSFSYPSIETTNTRRSKL